MSYQVLARKWRPRTFAELVGQEHVVRALVNALDHQRLHHAFLFTDTRGVGKTTLARIFAKALNCQTGVSSHPCGVCPACRDIDAGRFVDLIEVDAASRTKVEDTRDLLENVQYAPTQGRYKVYLIDEVHMLSTHSFNALLKTLEEPPPHIKFLLATTDPQRLPVTVLSRCLQFHLKRLPDSLIAAHLDAVLEQEDIAREPLALALLARAGDGSMRDALSLTDQAIAFGGGAVRLADVGAMLGTIDPHHVTRLLEALAAGDGMTLLDALLELEQAAPDYASILAELLSLLQRIALVQAIPGAPDDGLVDPAAVRRLAALLSPEEVQLYYQIALLGRRDLPLAPEPRGGFEMILLRMLSFRPVVMDTASPTAAVPSRPTATHPLRVAETAPPPVAARPPAPDSEWAAIVERLGLTGAGQQLALNCLLQSREGGTVRLLLPPGYAMRTRNAEEQLRVALGNYYGEPVKLQIQLGEPVAMTPARQQAEQQAGRQQAAVEAIQRDPNVRALCETFDGQVKPDSITPID